MYIHILKENKFNNKNTNQVQGMHTNKVQAETGNYIVLLFLDRKNFSENMASEILEAESNGRNNHKACFFYLYMTLKRMNQDKVK